MRHPQRGRVLPLPGGLAVPGPCSVGTPTCHPRHTLWGGSKGSPACSVLLQRGGPQEHREAGSTIPAFADSSWQVLRPAAPSTPSSDVALDKATTLWWLAGVVTTGTLPSLSPQASCCARAGY